MFLSTANITTMFIVKYKSLFIGIALAMVVGSILVVAHFGIKKGIDFTGGTVVEISYASSTPQTVDHAAFEAKGIKVFATGDKSYKFITKESYEETTKTVSALLNKSSHPYVETQVNTVGPSMGNEMTKKAMIAIVIVAIAILSFIAFAFREVSEPVASWKYGMVAMITVIHDIIIPTGVYAFLSATYGAEIDTLFVVALLTVMAVTISDKIVVFDRIRENLKTYGNKRPFDDVVGDSLRQTFTRSINTSVTVILSLLALYFLGPVSTKFFALTLMAGMVVGTYSSIFVASPALTYLVAREKGGKKK